METMVEKVDVTRSDWHVLTKTENGTVSLVRNLPLREAVDVYDRLDPHRGRVSGQMYPVNGGDIQTRELLGPDGWDGCTKAGQHSFTNRELKTVDQGPNVGRKHETATCEHCGFYLFRWLDDAALLEKE